MRIRIFAATVLALLMSAAARADTVTYYHNDLLGSPQVATTTGGAVVWRERFGPHGEREILDSASSRTEIWYTSRPEDGNSELVYMGARFYDPVVGRFLSVDPNTFDGKNLHSFNRYAYANNNPYAFVDPDGRVGMVVIGWVIRATGAGYGAGVMADAASQAFAWGTIDWGLAMKSNAAVAGLEAGLGSGFLPGAAAETAIVGVSARKSSNEVGRQGETFANIVYDIGEKVRILVNGRARIPDGLNETARVLSEVKNVESLSFTSQLRDFAQYAFDRGFRFDLYTRPNTHLSGPLKDAIDKGLINHIPTIP